MANYVTLSAITARLIRLSGQVPGTGVQIYSNDIFADMINTTVRMIARRYWWPHFMDWISVTTSPSTGVPDADLTGVLDHTDIKAIFANNCPDPLPYISDNVNPQYYSGNRALGYEALPLSNSGYQKRLIRVVPYTSQDPLQLRVRLVPTDLGQNDIVPLDQDLIVFGVLWAYFEDEGDNPQQAKKYQGLFDAKFTELVSAMSTHRVPIEQYDGGSSTWNTGDATYSNNQNTTAGY